LAHHGDKSLSPADTLPLSNRGRTASRFSLLIGAIGLAAAIVLAIVDPDSQKRLGFAYLTSFAYVLSIALGALFFVLIQHLTRAGWSVMVRRTAEALAASFPVLAVLFIPIVVLVLMNDGCVYPWAQTLGHHEATQEHAAATSADAQAAILTVAHRVENDGAFVGSDAHAANDAAPQPDVATAGHVNYGNPTAAVAHDLPHMVEAKRWWLNTPRFLGSWVIYFAIWCGLGIWYWKQSTQQDQTGDAALTLKMEKRSPIAMLLFGWSLTYAAFDLLMSLDPTWYSTIFGVYYFAGGMVGAISTIILLLLGLQRAGLMKNVSIDHYHDLGKLLFAFVVFWAYIAYSQYMLIWYSSIPAEIPWMAIRGLSTAAGHETPYQMVALVLLVGHFAIPFLGLMSRSVKRKPALLGFFAVWLLVVHFIDMYWLVMPQFDHTRIYLPLVELACLAGIGGLFFGVAGRVASTASPIPMKDPRIGESLRFENI
jgi:hypothetical protein